MRLLINGNGSVFGGYLARRLAIDGNEVELVTTDEAMEESAEVGSFDVVIVVTPFSYVRSIQTLNFLRKRMRVIILSSVTDEKTVTLAYKMGVVAYMTLPVDMTRLILKIRTL